jgi:hypothetical protein
MNPRTIITAAIVAYEIGKTAKEVYDRYKD